MHRPDRPGLVVVGGEGIAEGQPCGASCLGTHAPKPPPRHQLHDPRSALGVFPESEAHRIPNFGHACVGRYVWFSSDERDALDATPPITPSGKTSVNSAGVRVDLAPVVYLSDAPGDWSRPATGKTRRNFGDTLV